MGNCLTRCLFCDTLFDIFDPAYEDQYFKNHQARWNESMKNGKFVKDKYTGPDIKNTEENEYKFLQDVY